MIDIKVKERPILFSGPMVQAILTGRKTQTRRAVKWSARAIDQDGCHILERHDGTLYPANYCDGNEIPIRCPYGNVGDQLWVREAWAVVPQVSDSGPKHKAKGDGTGATWRAAWDGNPSGFKWKPSIHMPRWASRITLEITSVKIERLCEIDAEDVFAEGAVHPDFEWWHVDSMVRFEFQSLWESINGEGSWALNPWVWVIEFKRL